MNSVTKECGAPLAATGAGPPEPVVSVRGLVKRYGSHEAGTPRGSPGHRRRGLIRPGAAASR
jgi:hypothetical protein